MEAFKYVTQEHLDRIERVSCLTPRRHDGRTYAIPDDPNLWGDYIGEVFDHLIKRGTSPIILIKFVLNETDPDVGVQEGSIPFFEKPDTRVWIGDYVRQDFKYSELVIFRPISLQEISVLQQVR